MEQALGVLIQLVDAPGIHALAFENAGREMQAVRQHMNLALAPRNDLAVEPERAVALIERNDFGHGIPRKSGLLGLNGRPIDVNMTAVKPVKLRLFVPPRYDERNR